jgi:hypothetical protein
MSIATKLTTIAENVQKVDNAGYEKGKGEGGNTEEAFADGKAAGEKLMWDGLTANNTRTGWQQQFRNWQIEYLRPPYVIAPKANAINAMFEGNKLLKKVECAYFDFSGYTDMALGISKMMGISLDKNFDIGPSTNKIISNFSVT